MTYFYWILAASAVSASGYAIWAYLGRRSKGTFDAGSVSQSWLTEHRSDRYS